MTDLLDVLQKNAAETSDPVLRDRLNAAIGRLRQRKKNRRGEPRQGRKGEGGKRQRKGEGGRRRSQVERRADAILQRYE
jgi:hypothetical protein